MPCRGPTNRVVADCFSSYRRTQQLYHDGWMDILQTNDPKIYYQSNSMEQYSTKRWKVIEHTHVLQLSLQWRDLSTK